MAIDTRCISGIISAANARALVLGAVIGAPAKGFVDAVASLNRSFPNIV